MLFTRRNPWSFVLLWLAILLIFGVVLLVVFSGSIFDIAG